MEAPTSSTPPVSPIENTSTNHPTPNKDTKAILIGFGITGILLVILTTIFLLSQNKANPQKPLTNNASNTNTNTSSDSQRFAYLPSNLCPDSVFEENGLDRADHDGNHYIIPDGSKDWIMQNCASITKGISVNNNQNTNNTNSQPVANNNQPVVENEPPLLLKSLGFNLAAYDSSTNKAGDIQFTKVSLPFDQIFSPYGQQDPRTTDTTKINPQPTVILPLGTKVLSIVDGVVTDVKELYSGDMTIWIAKSTNSSWTYEIEHVINPTVKKGDTVTAGQVIAEVSDYDSHNHPGFGLVEIGILHSSVNNRPEHVCPYKYLDPSIKTSVDSKLMNLYSAWETYLGKDIYNQESFVAPGCVTEAPFEE